MTMFLEAINSYGGISADWVLVIETGIIGAILAAMIKLGLNKLSSHERRLNDNDVQHAKFEEQIKSGIETGNIINRQQDEKLHKIFEKLDRLKSA